MNALVKKYSWFGTMFIGAMIGGGLTYIIYFRFIHLLRDSLPPHELVPMLILATLGNAIIILGVVGGGIIGAITNRYEHFRGVVVGALVGGGILSILSVPFLFLFTTLDPLYWIMVIFIFLEIGFVAGAILGRYISR